MKRKLLALCLALTMSVSLIPMHTVLAETVDGGIIQEEIVETMGTEMEESAEEQAGEIPAEEIEEMPVKEITETVPAEETEKISVDEEITEIEESTAADEDHELALFSTTEIWDGTTATAFAGGSGTAEDPYLIENGAQLANIGYDGYYKLTADIYLNDTTDWEDWTAEDSSANLWTPLCRDISFNGTLDGNGFTIYGLYISETEEAVGLFSRTYSAEFMDLSVEQSQVFGEFKVGTLVGQAAESEFTDCHNGGNVTGINYVAGLIAQITECKITDCSNAGAVMNINDSYSGSNEALRTAGIAASCNNSEVVDCVNTGDVSSCGSQVGGIVGQAFYDSKLKGCVNKGAVTVYEGNDDILSIGGILGGSASVVTISDCENQGTVYAEGYRVGGIVGDLDEDCVITGSVNSGEVTGHTLVGGITGEMYGGMIEFCENTGTVAATNSTYGGGVAGRVRGGVIRNSFNTGDVAVKTYNGGGIAGGITDEAIIANCYNRGEISGTNSIGGICGNDAVESPVINCWNGGNIECDRNYGYGTIVGAGAAGITHCYALPDCCGETAADGAAVTEITAKELKSTDHLQMLNDWVLNHQKVDTGYAYWETDSSGYPAPTGEVPDFIPVTGSLTLHQHENGTGKLSQTSAVTNAEIIITIEADEGYIPDKVWYCSTDDAETKVYAEQVDENTFIFIMPYGDADVYFSMKALPAEGEWDGTAAESYAGGSGTEEDPYLIENAAQLKLMAEEEAFWEHYRLIADIDLNDTSDWENWSVDTLPANIWTPIQNLYGSFDGDGYTIYGLYTDGEQSCQGLFAEISSRAVIKDLEIAESHVLGTESVGSIVGEAWGTVTGCINRGKVTAFEPNSGGIAGWSGSGSLTENCENYGDILSVAEVVGGIIGNAGGTVKNCDNYGKVKSTLVSGPNGSSVRVGGIVGNAGGTVSDCQNHGVIEGYRNVGGVAGQVNGGTVENCINDGKIIILSTEDEDGIMGGGIAGNLTNAAVLKDCINNADVSGADQIGGICGYQSSGTEITGCTNTGTVCAEVKRAGGVVGNSSGLVEDCVNEGDVSVTSENKVACSGGIVGNTSGGLIVRNCINHGDISGFTDVGGILGVQRLAEITGCTNNGTVHATQSYAGGITGQLYTYGEGTALVELCVNTGEVSAGQYFVGGLVGYAEAADSGTAVIRNCYSTGDVSGVEFVAGLVGDLWADVGSVSSVENCYSAGNITGDKLTSGTVSQIVAAEDAAATVKNCYSLYSADVTKDGNDGKEIVTNVKTLTKNEMGQQSSFTGFDFTTVWFCAGDGSYPILRGKGEVGELGDVLVYNYYENGAVIVTADEENTESVYAILASYEGGKMKSMDMVELSAGEEGALTLRNWGQDVKLFAVSEDHEPICSAEEL